MSKLKNPKIAAVITVLVVVLSLFAGVISAFVDNVATVLMVAPVALAYLGYGIHTDKIIIGSIMLLVPGIAITNVMRDVLAEDFLTALTRLAEVLIVAVGIAETRAENFGQNDTTMANTAAMRMTAGSYTRVRARTPVFSP